MTQFVEPIMQRTFSIKKSALSHVHVFASLDRGCSLTKIIYVDKSDADKLDDSSKSEVIILTIALFHNSNFDNALMWLKEKAVFPENKEYPLHSTGVGGATYGGKIKEILGRDGLFIDEFLSQSRGSYYLLLYAPLDEITFEDEQIDSTETFDVPVLNNVKNQFEEIVGNTKKEKCLESAVPCMFGFCGSALGLTYIGADGSFHMTQVLHAFGKSFVGLARHLLGTNSYQEITTMAERGDRRNLETSVKDRTSNESSRGTKSTEFPSVLFGKLAKTNKDIKEFNKDDIAHSLVSMYVQNTINATINSCMVEKVKNVFFGGNLFQAKVFRKELKTLLKMYGFDFLNVHFINNGHTGALGAMISMPEDKDQYLID